MYLVSLKFQLLRYLWQKNLALVGQFFIQDASFKRISAIWQNNIKRLIGNETVLSKIWRKKFLSQLAFEK